jgi:hypothetical protein
MPYGGEESDHDFIRNREKEHAPSSSTIKFIYAGAMLPKAYKPLEEVFKALNSLQTTSLGLPTEGELAGSNLQLNFIGTLGTIKPFAEQYNLWGSAVLEHPDRIPYLDVLSRLDAADAVFILGSTEPHYTPSKVYQAVLSGKPILAVLHEASTAVKVLRESMAGIVVTMKGEEDLDTLSARFLEGLKEFMVFKQTFDPGKINRAAFEQYSAKAVTAILVEKLDLIVSSAAGRG